ncbi:hypothetical protein VTO73DRAFT_12712 [Trametes versicolor]
MSSPNAENSHTWARVFKDASPSLHLHENGERIRVLRVGVRAQKLPDKPSEASSQLIAPLHSSTLREVRRPESMCAGQRVLWALWSVALERTLGLLGVTLQIYRRSGRSSMANLKVIVVSPAYFALHGKVHRLCNVGHRHLRTSSSEEPRIPYYGRKHTHHRDIDPSSANLTSTVIRPVHIWTIEDRDRLGGGINALVQYTICATLTVDLSVQFNTLEASSLLEWIALARPRQLPPRLRVPTELLRAQRPANLLSLSLGSSPSLNKAAPYLLHYAPPGSRPGAVEGSPQSLNLDDVS